MSNIRHTHPPLRKPHIAISHTPSPVWEDLVVGPEPSNAILTGLEFIVSKLPCNGINAATLHLRVLIGEYTKQHPLQPPFSVCITPGDERNLVNYVFLSIDLSVFPKPRPDLLKDLRSIIVSHFHLHAQWKAGKGLDRTRRINFQFNSYAQAEAIQTRLNTSLNDKGCPYQCSFVSRAMQHVTYDLLDHSLVDKLFKDPPVIDHHILNPSVPRFIQPVYGLEVAVLGLGDTISVKAEIDQYIHAKYGDVIACSHLALNGYVYCIVFNAPDQAFQFLSDPFTVFDSGFGVYHNISHIQTGLLEPMTQKESSNTVRRNSQNQPLYRKSPHGPIMNIVWAHY